MSLLRKIWEKWKQIGQFIGDVIARVVLTLFYFTVFVPFGMGVRLLADPLRIRGKEAPEWQERTPTKDSLAEARSQAS